MNPHQESILSSVAYFNWIVGDILSARIFDCVSALRRQPCYARRLKQLTEKLERVRRQYESGYRSIKKDDFPDDCERVEEIFSSHFVQIQSCVRIALGAMKEARPDTDKDLYTNLLCTTLLAQIAARIIEASDVALYQIGVVIRVHKYDLAKTHPLLKNIALEYAGELRTAFLNVVADSSVRQACDTLYCELVDKTFIPILKNKPL